MPRSRIELEIKQNKPFPRKSQEAAVALLRTADLLRRNFAAAIEPLGVTVQQFNVLRILRGAGDAGLPTLEIAERMVEQTPGITRLLDRLEAKHLVVRKRCLTDRRQVLCRITSDGLATLDSLEPALRHSDVTTLGMLSNAELSQLLDLLDRARTILTASLQGGFHEEVSIRTRRDADPRRNAVVRRSGNVRG